MYSYKGYFYRKEYAPHRMGSIFFLLIVAHLKMFPQCWNILYRLKVVFDDMDINYTEGKKFSNLL